MCALDNIADNKKILKNTVALYVRMLVTMFVGLFTSRIVLQILGVVDFGINNVVSGFVVMFSFLNSTMTASTQRYLSFAIAQKDHSGLNKFFNAAMGTHFVIALIVVALAETVGLWFLNNKMNIPVDRIGAANWVYHFSVLAAVLSILGVPYQGIITAREKMTVYAYISILEVALKLLLVLSLYIINFDKLKLFSFVILLNAVAVFLVTAIYCMRSFAETRLCLVKEKKMYFELLNYAGWNLSSHIILVARTQGVNVLLNLFFGPVLNAARGIAVQVNDIIMRFVKNFQMAAVPQITKLYASGQIDEMKKLICMSSKISYLLLAFLMLPVILETEYILQLWLGNVPDWAVVFCRLTLISSLVDVLSGTLAYGANAVGVVRKYHAVIGGFLSLNFFLTYVLLKKGFSPTYIYYLEISIYIICLFGRLRFLKGYFGFSTSVYLKEVVARDLVVTLLTVVVAGSLLLIMEKSLVRCVLVCILSFSTTAISVLFLGLNKEEKEKIYPKIKSKISFLRR